MEKHGATPFAIALAWLRHLNEVIVPLPGPSRPEHATEIAGAWELRLDAEDLIALDQRFPAGRSFRLPVAARRPPDGSDGDVVLLVGLPGAGKSTLAAELVAQGYERLNRDEAGGRLRDLAPALADHLRSGRKRVVLDNTYGARAARHLVIETAWAHGVPVRCVWLRTELEQAQVNVTRRLVRRHGRLLAGAELEAAGREDPGAFGPDVLFRHQRRFEPPAADEGFATIEERKFVEQPGFGRAGLFVRYDGVLHRSRAGLRAPRDASDAEVPAGLGDLLRQKLQARGDALLFGYAWRPEAQDEEGRARVATLFEQTHRSLGVELEPLFCSHGDGRPVCWCRPPLPGLAVEAVERHALDSRQCALVGLDANDRGLARRMGFRFFAASEFFA